MRFLKKFQKKSLNVTRFLRKNFKKKRKKLGLKTETEIRGRRRELFGIRENWMENGEEHIEDIDAVIAEFNWILGEENKQKQNSYSELLKAKRQIKELEKRNRKLQVTINIMRGD